MQRGGKVSGGDASSLRPRPCLKDHDFSLLRAHHFCKEEGLSRPEETIDSHLLEVSKASGGGPVHALHDSCMFTNGRVM